MSGLAVAFIIGTFNQSLVADSDKNLHKMFYVKLKTGHTGAFYEKLAEHAAWRRENGDPWTWWVHTIVNGENDGDCVIRSGGVSWAEMDEYEEFLAKGGAKFWKTVGEHIEDTSSWISMGDKRFARWHPDMEKINLISVISYELKPGSQKDFTDAVQVYHDAIAEHDFPTYYQFSWPINGSSGNGVTLALFFENYADMAPPEEKMQEFMKRVLGEEEAQAAVDKFTGAIRSSSSRIVRYLPGLSIVHEKE